ncbi:MAG: class I SAM-dependent methyltransferase [Bacteroidota bacterium]
MDILGKALLDFQTGDYTEDIKTFSSLNEEDILEVPYLFRNFNEMPLIEQKALAFCQGNVLDVGCGAGSHSLYLQENGFEVVGLDQSKGAIKVCKERGVKKTVCAEFLNFSETGFDTLLLLMNGIGISGKLERLAEFLNHTKKLLNPGGQLILDSSDIIYMFEKDEDGGYWVPGDTPYYGEVRFQMGYKRKKGPIFDWLYLDFNTLKNTAENAKWRCEMICEGNHYDYLARLTLK